MPTYIALLRGINVGGNVLKMERLREIWAELGFKKIRTYVQSGNIVFDAVGSPMKWATAVDKKLAGEARLPVTVIYRTPQEFASILAANPFLAEPGVDPARLHVTFLSDPASKQALQKLGEVDAGADKFHYADRVVYLHCPHGYGKTRLSNNAIEKILGTRATTRNWNTINKLHDMATNEGS